MANGKPGDSPWGDFFIHGCELFPEDMARMLRAVHGVSPSLIEHLAYPDMWAWANGADLEEGREKLRRIVFENKIALDRCV